MKQLVASLLILAGLSLPTYGLMFEGTFTLEVTAQTDARNFKVGDMFMGYFQYDSPTLDGTFHFDKLAPGLTVMGHIDAPSPLGGDLGPGLDIAYLTVGAGRVTDFSFTDQRGADGITLTYSTFHVREGHFGEPTIGEASGSVRFGSLIMVPEPTQAAFLILAGIATLFRFRTKVQG